VSVNSALLNVALNLLLTPRLGKEGAALSTLLSQAVVPVWLFWRSQQLYPIPYRFGAAAAILAAAGAVTAIGVRVSTGHVLADLALKAALLALLLPLLPWLRVIEPGLLGGLRRRVGATAQP
jgi:O-antigen/teichoic acid export membrane protein